MAKKKPTQSTIDSPFSGEMAYRMIATLARKNFYAFCRFRLPRFFLPHRTYLKELCDTLQAFHENRLLDALGKPYSNLIINEPPRHGKTLTIILFCQWVLGVDPTMGIITASYNELLSSRMAKAVRDGISELKVSPDRLVYGDYFPKTKIKKGDASMQVWSLEDSHFSYLATSPGGTMTGIGARLMLIDDLIKNYEEACNARILEEHYEWYQNTTQSRLEIGAKQIIIATRWATKDLCGRLIASNPDDWYVIKKQAHLGEGRMLAPDILTFEEFERRRVGQDAQLIQANYQQEPYDSFDKLYGTFKTYVPGMLPAEAPIKAVTDTADTGADFLAHIVCKVYKNTAYVIDVIYSQESMELTEFKVAKSIADTKTRESYIESNNGGRGFARNVERILRESLKYPSCRMLPFTQTGNKVARILSNSTAVTNSVIFPHDWRDRWPQFYKDVTEAGRAEKWVHDDAMDVLTLVVEKLLTSGVISTPKVDIRGFMGI